MSQYNPQYIFDNDTAIESMCSIDSFSALGILSSPVHFRNVCVLFDKLMGRRSTVPPASEIVNDSSRSWYTFAAAYIMRQTRLEIDELERVLEHMLQALTNKQGRIDYIKQADALVNTTISFCRYMDFEPRWHQRRREDDRPLPTDKNKDLWGYLLRLYTDPEYSRMRMPDNIRRIAPMYKGYEDCVKKAVAEGHRQLQAMYGADVDLSPITEKRHQEDDFDGSSFMRLLSKGSPF